MLQEEVPQRSIKRVLDVGCWMLQDHEDRQEGRRQDVPTNGSADKHEELPKVARTSVETSATDHTR